MYRMSVILFLIEKQIASHSPPAVNSADQTVPQGNKIINFLDSTKLKIG